MKNIFSSWRKIILNIFIFQKKSKKSKNLYFRKYWFFNVFDFFWKMKISKIIFLHDEKIFFIQIFFYDLEFNYTLRLAHFGSHRECTVRGTTRNLKIRSFFVLIAVWVPSWLPTWWIFCARGVKKRLFRLSFWRVIRWPQKTQAAKYWSRFLL